MSKRPKKESLELVLTPLAEQVRVIRNGWETLTQTIDLTKEEQRWLVRKIMEHNGWVGRP